MKNLIIIGDADGLIAFINPQDASNKKVNIRLTHPPKLVAAHRVIIAPGV
jgi:hypothetical protein